MDKPNELKMYEYKDKTYILNGKSMWLYDGESIAIIEHKPIIRQS